METSGMFEYEPGLERLAQVVGKSYAHKRLGEFMELWTEHHGTAVMYHMAGGSIDDYVRAENKTWRYFVKRDIYAYTKGSKHAQ